MRDWLHVDDHCHGIQLVLDGGPAGGDLQHRRRHGTDEQGTHLPSAGRHGRRRGHDPAGRGPQGPRPAVLRGHHEDLVGIGVQARGGRSTTGLGPDDPVVPRQRGLVAAAEGRSDDLAGHRQPRPAGYGSHGPARRQGRRAGRPRYRHHRPRLRGAGRSTRWVQSWSSTARPTRPSMPRSPTRPRRRP
ncbi:MAG: hypothetical protein V9G10_11325 [Candidatus Nanopelagicales bacterium]